MCVCVCKAQILAQRICNNTKKAAALGITNNVEQFLSIAEEKQRKSIELDGLRRHVVKKHPILVTRSIAALTAYAISRK